ncbi:hypothetical protein LTR78_005520 [Recurvomyces mirabilis]|uniref:Uncharacterized protein n=1 Tax=Recurvomyces mirabilis TaxID=574656 RepID=A0AAE0WMG9_9PEZI|nr:hypothetical protein LTR78_005520 [Recurvomyces mirabilis]KAK5158489.1 hypothetical protein LTS14_003508 [Recurvomyces mirabilis]
MNRVRRAPLENALLRSSGRHNDSKTQLLSWLDGNALRCLRAVCTVLHNYVDSKPGRPFRGLYASATTADVRLDLAWRRIAKFCYILTITISAPSTQSAEDKESSSQVSSSRRKYSTLSDIPLYQKGKSVLARLPWNRPPPNEQLSRYQGARLSIAFDRRSNPDQDLQDDATAHWLSLLAPCHQLRTIILRVHGDPSWPGRTKIERTLITIRSALEQSELPHLTEIRFAPIHIMGIIHLRWAGLGVFGFASIPSPSPSPLEQSILSTLQIITPFHGAKDSPSPAQKQMSKKILHDFLRSFTPTLRVLRFLWLGAEGPSPLLLHLDFEDEDPSIDKAECISHSDQTPTMTALHWTQLEEIYLGSITHPQRTIALALESAPRLRKFWMLRWGSSSHQRAFKPDDGNEADWVDVVPMPVSRAMPSTVDKRGRRTASTMMVALRRRSDVSSIYSQEDE